MRVCTWVGVHHLARMITVVMITVFGRRWVRVCVFCVCVCGSRSHDHRRVVSSAGDDELGPSLAQRIAARQQQQGRRCAPCALPHGARRRSPVAAVNTKRLFGFFNTSQ